LDKPQLAKNLLNDEFFMGELEALKNSELQTIVYSQPNQAEEREVAYSRINALQLVIAHFESIAATSEIAKKRWKIL
jgi:uncharacterized DUF497 family protein